MNNYIFCLVIFIVLLLKMILNILQAWTIKSNNKKLPSMFANYITLNEHQTAAKYNIAKLNLNLWQIVFEAIIMILFTVGGGIEFINNVVSKYINTSSLSFGVAVMILYFLINAILNLPFAYISTFYIETKYGFNKTTRLLFIVDLLKGLMIGAVVVIPLLYLVLWLMNTMGSSWWLWVFATIVGFNILVMMIYPVFIAPIFNKFEPLDDENLKVKINKLLNTIGFKSKGVFIMDGSKRSSHGNAYFTGIGSAKRIVFFDTLIKKLTPEQILAVLAHELGHFKKKHIIKQIIMNFIIMFIMLFISSHLLLEPIFYSSLGVTTINTANGLLLLMIVFNLVELPLAPLMSYLSRKNEFEADEFAIKYTNKNDLIDGLMKLYKDNASTLTPNKYYVKFYYSHPPASERIKALELLN